MATEKPKRKGIPNHRRRFYLLGALVCLSFIFAGAIYLNTSNQPPRLFTKPTEPITAENLDKVEFLGQLPLPKVGINVHFSADSRLMLFTVIEGASIWDLDAGSLKMNINETSVCRHDDPKFPEFNCAVLFNGFSRAFLSPDGKWAATAIRDDDYNEIRLWNLETGQLIKSFGKLPDSKYWGMWAILFDPLSQYFVYQIEHNGTLETHIWNLLTQKDKRLLVPEIRSRIVFTSDSRRFLYPIGNVLYEYNLDNDLNLPIIEDENIIGFSVSPTARYVLIEQRITPSESLERLWYLETNEMIDLIQTGYNLGGTFSPDGDFWVFQDEREEYILRYDMSTGQKYSRDWFYGWSYWTLSPNNELVAGVTGMGIQIYSFGSNVDSRKVENPNTKMWSLAIDFSPDGTLIVSNDGMMWGIPAD